MHNSDFSIYRTNILYLYFREVIRHGALVKYMAAISLYNIDRIHKALPHIEGYIHHAPHPWPTLAKLTIRFV